MNNKVALLEASRLTKIFRESGEDLCILDGLELHIFEKEFITLGGNSGAGKSTLLHILGGLDKPTEGSVSFKGEALFQMKEKHLNEFRNKHMGFIFQFHHLLPDLNALENVLVPAMIARQINAEAKKYAEHLLEYVGLKERLKHHPNQLSGGEKQRVAVARSLMNRPDVILADEPSGNLDERNSHKLHELFIKLNEEQGQAFLIVTHDKNLYQQGKTRLVLTRGKISTDESKS